MNHQLFSALYHQAMKYTILDQYISDLGQQDWMGKYGEIQLREILTKIYDLANNDFTTNRKLVDENRSEFARMYNIPIRTVQSWELGERKIIGYVKELIDYSIFVNELFNLELKRNCNKKSKER